MLIGREDADITIGDPQVSRRHAHVRPSGAGIEIEDAGSSNGTFINGVQISSATPLQNGDTIRVGQTEIDVEIPEREAGTVIAGAPPQGTVVAPKSPSERPGEPPAAAPPAATPPAAAPGPQTPPPYAPPGGPPSFTPPPGQGPPAYQGAGYGPPTGPQYAPGVRPKGAAPSGGGSKGLIVGLIVGLAVLVAAALVFFFFIRSSDEDEIRETLESIAANPADPDICDLISQSFKEEVSGLEGSAADEDCRDSQSEVSDEAQEIEIENIDVNGENATAEVTPEGEETVTVRLVDEDGTWKFDGTDES